MAFGAMKAVLAGVAILGATVLPQVAAATPLTGTYDIKIYQGNGGGNSASPIEQATNTNPLLAGSVLADITYTGALDFALGSGGTNTIAAFLASAGGSYTTVSGSIGSQQLSTSPFALTSLFSITGTTAASISGTVTHDDGASLYQGASTIFNSQGPTVAIPSSYSLAAGAFNLVYVEANGLPAVLDVEVPEPASFAVLALGLVGLYSVRRARRA